MATLNGESKHKARIQRRKQASRRRRGLLWALVGGIGLFVAWLVIANPLTSTSKNVQSAAEPAPDITLMTKQGDYRLSDQKGQVVALYFSFVG